MDLFNLIWFLLTLSVVSSKEYVPVLVWSTQTTADSYPVISTLRRLSSNEFSDYLLKRVKVENPTILVFTEENLSVEDFSWRDVNENGAFPMLTNITKLADDVAFLPSVHDPYRALKKLKNHGYTWKYYEKDGFESLKDKKKSIFEIKLEESDYLEDRPDMLRRHDEQMAKVYNEALTYMSNIMVVYTGNHTSWIDAELGRFKREEKDSNASTTWIITDKDNVIMLSVTPPIVFEDKAGDGKMVQITQVIGTPVIKNTKEALILRVNFPVNPSDSTKNFFEFMFESDEDEWWTLKGIDNPGEQRKTFTLLPSTSITAPSSHSYFCNPSVVFKYGNISLTFENFQVQPRVGKGNSFGPVIHCIPYFSIAIWSGLVVAVILSVVLAWGIVMIMDINTNDRFDDPKGKTITITATD